MLKRLGMTKGSPVSYPLDLVSATPAFAYSLRQLKRGYTGNCIKVRRSTDNTTQDIGFIKGWLDVASLNTFLFGATGFVARWYDQSGNSRDAIQATAAAQPQLLLGIQNSQPALQCTGSEFFSAVTIAQGATVLSNCPHTILTSMKANSIGAYHNILDTATACPMLWASSSNNFEIDVGLQGGATGAFKIVSALVTTNVGRIRQNGVQASTGSTTTPANKPWLVGLLKRTSQNSSFQGKVGTLIFWDSDIGNAAVGLVEVSEQKFWGA